MKKIIIILLIVVMIGCLSISSSVVGTEVVNYSTGNQYEESKEVIVKSIFDNSDLDINRMEIKSEEDFVEYMKGVGKEIKNIVSKDTITKDDKEVLKKTFIDLADFVFYDKEIKGYKFKDLSLTSKKEVLKYYNDVDKKIEKVYPNYKKVIEANSKKTYNDLKEKASKMLEEYKEQLKAETYSTCKKESKSVFTKINKFFNDLFKKVSD